MYERILNSSRTRFQEGPFLYEYCLLNDLCDFSVTWTVSIRTVYVTEFRRLDRKYGVKIAFMFYSVLTFDL